MKRRAEKASGTGNLEFIEKYGQPPYTKLSEALDFFSAMMRSARK